MGFYGAPSYEAKWNARMWVDEAVARGAVLETGARVREVIVERGRATGVVYTRGRRTFRAHAGRVVLAAGGIGSPTILRASGLEGTGRDFFVDPLVFAVGQVEGPGGPAELPMSTGLHLHADGVMMTDYAMPRLMHNLNALQVGALGNMRAQPYAHSLVIMVKVKDELGGRLTSRGGVRRRLSAADHAKLDHGYRLARAILERAGAREVYKTRVIAAHPGGTVKLGELVDENLETSIANLHVCDCSVVPEAWGLPPTLALIGLGKYLARRVTASDRTHPGTQPRANIE
jgi:choline dehydrogenase-like flavoprotein